MGKKRIVIALGGNALGKNLPEQYLAVQETSKAIADLIEAGNEVIISHGNGPQVGMINNAMAAYSKTEPSHPAITPLSVCVAMSQAYIGYDLQNALKEELLNRGIKKNVATVITQVRVDENDPAFEHPTKPIGQFMTKEEADAAVASSGIQVTEDAGRGYRRVVASPKPAEIIEIDTVKDLLERRRSRHRQRWRRYPCDPSGKSLKGCWSSYRQRFRKLSPCTAVKCRFPDHSDCS